MRTPMMCLNLEDMRVVVAFLTAILICMVTNVCICLVQETQSSQIGCVLLDLISFLFFSS
jgi:hypothetical protein